MFDSDYLEGCIPEILSALCESNMKQTSGYGMDPFCREAKAAITDAFSLCDASIHFLVGGTQANNTVISHVLRPHQGVVCATTGHINVHETGAVEHSAHKILTVPSYAGKMRAEDLDRIFAEHYDESSPEHAVQPAMVYVSFPTELGTVYTKAELSAISKVCRKWGASLFLDGARLGYGLCAQNCNVMMNDIASMCDVFTVGGTKQGALFGEAVVFTDKSLAKDFRYSMKQNGGMLAKGRLLGLQFSTLFSEDGRAGSSLYISYSRKAVALAMRLKGAFAAHGIKFLVDSPTNQQFPILENGLMRQLGRNFSFEQWGSVDQDHTAVRFCTSWATRPESVEALIAALGKLCK